MRKKANVFEKDAFNAYQNFLYKRALFGLGVYDKEEIQKMSIDKRKRVQKVNWRCQQILNIWKQQLCNEYTNRIFKALFPGKPGAVLFYETYKDSVDPGFINRLDFKDMGVTKAHIVDKLILEGVLPKDFYSLKHAPTKEEKV
jgi:hypothetical protein